MPEGIDAVLSTEWKIQRYRLKNSFKQEGFNGSTKNFLPLCQMGKQPAVSHECNSTAYCTPECAYKRSNNAAEKA